MQRVLSLLLTGCLLLVLHAPVAAQQLPLAPVDEPDPTRPMLPAGVMKLRPEIFGNYTHLWEAQDGAQVILYYGDFTLQIGDRRLVSRDAVVWMQRSAWQGLAYYHYEVFLSHEAHVRETAGTMTSGPVLLVTFNSTESPVIEADVSVALPAVDSKLYQEALEVREAVRGEALPETLPRDLHVTDLVRPAFVSRPRAAPVVRHRADEEIFDEAEGIITATGRVYLSQGRVESGDFLEIRADAAVLFLAERDDERRPAPDPDLAPDLEPFPVEDPEAWAPGREPDGLGLGPEAGTAIAGAYLRGDVVLSRGDRQILATELYYDFEYDRALMLDPVMRAMAPERNLPVYVRARQARQLSTTEYFAQEAMISTSEFHTPHIHIGAQRLYLSDATVRDETGDIAGLMAGAYRIYHSTLNVEGVPIAYWPYAAGDLRRSESSIRSVRTGFSNTFGATAQARWYMFSLLGMEDPPGVDAFLRTDYFHKRGPGLGIDADYEMEDRYGLLRWYYIHDRGRDRLGPFRDNIPSTRNRGRITLRHREFLPDDWELTLELSHISDPNFLEQYFLHEFLEGKEQETLIYLKKQQDNWAFTALAQWRLLDFLTQTEHLPDLGFRMIGEPLGEIASLYHETAIGMLRHKPDNRRLFNRNRLIDNTGTSGMTFRVDTRNEIDVPIKLGDVNVVPYAMGRAGYWDGSPWDGSLHRLFGSLGVRAGSQLWRLFEDVRSELLDINGIRHIIRPEATAWMSATNTDSFQLFPFDRGIEDIDDFYGTSVALRQRWQTKRGGPGQWRVVDWITLDLELNVFGNTPQNAGPIGRFYDSRPEYSIPRNHVRADFMYRISDTTGILADANFDIDDGSMDLFNVSYVVERSPRFSYALGYRRIGDIDSNLLSFGVNYELNVKHRLGVRALYDLERGESQQFDIILVRKFPRWYVALAFNVDNIQNDVGVSLAVWPEGAPEAVLGNRRYTGVSTATGLRPED